MLQNNTSILTTIHQPLEGRIAITNHDTCGLAGFEFDGEVWFAQKASVVVLRGVDVANEFTYVVFERVSISSNFGALQRVLSEKGEHQETQTLYKSKITLMAYIKKYWHNLNMRTQVFYRPQTRFLLTQFFPI